MEYKQEHIELTRNILTKSPGFKGNEDLLDEMLNETLKKSASFLECSLEVSSLEIYIKKIASNVVVDILRNAKSIRAEKTKKSQASTDFEEVPIIYETDSEGKIIYKVSLPESEITQTAKLSEEKINTIKKKVIELDKKSSTKNYKQIFELKFAKNLNCREISQKLNIEENEAANILLEILKEIDSA